MKYRDIGKIVFVVFAVTLLQGLAVSVNADEEWARTPFVYNNSAMSYPRGVRNIGMGVTGTADIKGFSTGFFNPASFAWTDAITIGGSYQEWVLDMKLTDTRISGGGQLSGGESESVWRFGGSVGYSTVTLQPKVQRTVFLPEGTGQPFVMDDYVVSGSGAVAWQKGNLCVGMGGTAKYLDETLGGTDLSTWAFDVGAIAAIPVSWNSYEFQPRLGAAVTNLGGEFTIGDDFSGEIVGEQRWALGLDVASPPKAFGSGLWRRDASVLSIAIDYDNVRRRNTTNNSTLWALGWEVSFLGTIQARYGLNNRIYPYEEEGTTYGFGFGWDFGRLLFQFDYAHISADAGVLEPIDENVFGFVVGGRL